MNMETTTTDSVSSDPLYAEIYALYDKTGGEQGFVDSETDDARPRISGQATPNSLVTIYDYDSNDGSIKPIGTAQVDSAGQWTFLPTEPLSDGMHDLFVTATNATGTSDPSGDMVFSIDTSGVVAGQLAINAVYDDIYREYIGNGKDTGDSRPTLEGTAEANSLVTIKDGTKVLGDVHADAWGYWSFTPDTALKAGPHDLVVEAGGKVSAPFEIQVDTFSAPEIPTITSAYDNIGSSQSSLMSGATTDDTSPRLSGTAEPGSLVTIMDGDKVLGSFNADPSGNWFFDTPPLGNGTHHLVAVSPYSQPGAEFDITIATQQAPRPPIIEIGQDDVGTAGWLYSGSNTDDTHPTLRGRGEPNSEVTIKDGNTVLGVATTNDQGDWVFEPQLGIGQHQLTAVSNVSGASAPFFLNVVGVAESALKIASAYDNIGNSQGSLMSGATTDDTSPRLSGTAVPGSLVTIMDGDKVLGSFNADPSGNWFFDTPPLGAGAHHLVAVGPYGQSSVPFDITVAGAPPVPVAPPVILYGIDTFGTDIGQVKNNGTTDDGRLTIYGRGAKDTWLSIKVDGHEIGTVKTDASGKWHYQPDAAMAMDPGPHTITASLPDGTVGANGTFEVTVVAATAAPTETAVASAVDVSSVAGAELSGPGQAHDAGASQPAAPAAVESHATTAPVIATMLDDVGGKLGFLQSGATTDDTRPNLRGSAEPGSLVTIMDGDKVIGTTHAADNGAGAPGSWSFTPDTPLENGAHHLTAVVNGQASYAFDITIDPASVPVPLPSITLVIDNTTYVGSSAPGQHIHDTHPQLIGKGQPGTTVTILDGDKVLGDAQVNQKGQWNFTPELDAGEHHLAAVSQDGQSGLSLVVFVDSVATTPGHAGGLSLNDVLSTDEGDLFAVSHAHDNATLGVHDLDTAAAVANSVGTNDAGGVTHDVSSSSTSLVLPHEQMHAHTVM